MSFCYHNNSTSARMKIFNRSTINQGWIYTEAWPAKPQELKREKKKRLNRNFTNLIKYTFYVVGPLYSIDFNPLNFILFALWPHQTKTWFSHCPLSPDFESSPWYLQEIRIVTIIQYTFFFYEVNLLFTKLIWKFNYWYVILKFNSCISIKHLVYSV